MILYHFSSTPLTAATEILHFLPPTPSCFSRLFVQKVALDPLSRSAYVVMNVFFLCLLSLVQLEGLACCIRPQCSHMIHQNDFFTFSSRLLAKILLTVLCPDLLIAFLLKCHKWFMHSKMLTPHITSRNFTLFLTFATSRKMKWR